MKSIFLEIGSDDVLDLSKVIAYHKFGDAADVYMISFVFGVTSVDVPFDRKDERDRVFDDLTKRLKGV